MISAPLLDAIALSEGLDANLRWRKAMRPFKRSMAAIEGWATRRDSEVTIAKTRSCGAEAEGWPNGARLRAIAHPFPSALKDTGRAE
jgi:hypothetical protein